MKALVIGCGRILYKHLESVKKFKNEIQIIGICDINSKKLKQLENKYNYNTYTDYKKAIKNLKPQLVIVLTPTGLHAEHTIFALQNHCHVILEKPMCLKISDGKKIIKVSRKFNKRVFVVMQNKFNLPIKKLREDINKNRFGKLLHGSVNVRWMRKQKYYDQAKWRGTWKFDGGVISNQASHHLDLMRTIMGDPISVYAISEKHLAKIQCEDTALIIFKFKGKKTGIMEATTAMRPYDVEGSFSLMGSKGSAKIGGFALNEISYYYSNVNLNKKKFKTNPLNVYGYGHTEFYKHFIESIRKNKKSEFECFEAIKTVELINAIYKSIETKKIIILNSRTSSKRLGK